MKKRPTYTTSFKLEAVALVLEKNYTFQQAGVNALQESLEGYWRTNIQAEHAAGFIGASEELRAKIEMPTAKMGILVNLATVSG